MAAFVHGQSIERALQYATAAGAQNVRVHDAISGILPYEETTQSLDKMPKRKLELKARGWKQDATTGTWHGPAE